MSLRVHACQAPLLVHHVRMDASFRARRGVRTGAPLRGSQHGIAVACNADGRRIPCKA